MSHTPRQTISPREIWIVSLDDTEGHEQRGTRPAIVISVHSQANVCMIIPLTSNQDTRRVPYTYAISCSNNNGLACNSIALIYQMRCLTSSRFSRRLGTIEQHHLTAINTLVRNYLKL